MHVLAAVSTLLFAPVEYPLAKQFIGAHANNYVAGGMGTPQYIIIHQQDGIYEGTISWFQYAGSNVSTHYVMRSFDGEITQMVEHADMAQHIGGWNPMSFGIEHEGYIDEPGWYTWETYVASAQLVRWLCDHYDIPADRDHVVGHVEVPGASHTDPGYLWNYDMHMALVRDVVPQGRVEGVVVDRSAQCVLTALEDTWITTTLENLDALDPDEMCFLAAGTELPYLHASDEMISQKRLTMDGGGPCAGIGELDTEAYIWLPSFTPTCAPESMAAAEGVTVRLDGVPSGVDAQGRFAFDGIAEGPHVLDVESDGAWVGTSVPIDVAVYPGARVVVAIDPADGVPPEPDPTDDDGTPPGQDSSAGEGPGEGMGDGDGAGSSGGGGTASDGGGLDGSLPPYEPSASGDGCGCRPSGSSSGSAVWALAVAFAAARRRRARGRGDRIWNRRRDDGLSCRRSRRWKARHPRAHTDRDRSGW
jgi:MYXO-CTERM domain-containing protein